MYVLQAIENRMRGKKGCAIAQSLALFMQEPNASNRMEWNTNRKLYSFTQPENIYFNESPMGQGEKSGKRSKGEKEPNWKNGSLTWFQLH